MKIRKIDIGEIEGFRIGNAENTEAGTGVTVIISEEGAVGGVDVRGGGPATRETDLLRSENTVDKVHAVVLSGGSAFGLEAASGVMRSLAERGIGFRTADNIVVPIVPAASLYDLEVGRSDVFPDVEMGREAVRSAYNGSFEPGNHGAGTGASVGKYLGHDRSMKTGIGTFACGDDFIQVGAIAAVNAVGDVYNGAGNIIAGLRTSDGSAIKGTIRVLKGLVHDESSADLDLSDIRTIAASEAVDRKVESYPDHKTSGSAGASEETAVSDEKDDIIRAMMRSYDQEHTASEAPAPAAMAEVHEFSGTDAVLESYEMPAAAAESETSASEEPHDFDQPQPHAEPEAEPDYNVPEQTSSLFAEAAHADEDQHTEETGAEIQAGSGPVSISEPEPVSEPASSSADQNTEEPSDTADAAAADDDDFYVLTEEDKADMGYDIPFNTTISCVITNAVLTKSQANKLASILHDAYARAVKPVHGTLDGDTIFVLSTCRQKVNFDAFAALATDVLQYAVIDGAASAESAYGLPAARDIIHK